MFGRILYNNFRVIYRISLWTRRRFTPAGILFLGCAIGSGIFGIDTRQTLAFQLFSLSASIILISMLAVFTFRGKFSIRRQLPEFGTVGENLSYKLVIENRGRRRQRDLVLFDELESPVPDYKEFRITRDPRDKDRNWFDRKVGYPRLMGIIQKKRGGSVMPVIMDDLPPGDSAVFNTSLMPIRRGYLNFNRTCITRPDPFGIYRAIINKKNEDSLLVLPKRYRMPMINLRGKRKYQKGGLSQAGSVGDSQEFISLRDYVPGDPMKAIHWRSYAKLGHPVVKEFHDEFYVRQGLMLDTFVEDNSDNKFEEAVSIAASLTVSLNVQDALLDLMFVGTEAYRFTSGRGLGMTENMLEILACVTPCFTEPFSRLENLLMQYTPDTSGLICIMLDWDDKRKELLKRIQALEIPLIIFLITDRDKPELDISSSGIAKDRFILLQPGQIQYQLDQCKIPSE